MGLNRATRFLRAGPFRDSRACSLRGDIRSDPTFIALSLKLRSCRSVAVVALAELFSARRFVRGEVLNPNIMARS